MYFIKRFHRRSEFAWSGYLQHSICDCALAATHGVWALLEAANKTKKNIANTPVVSCMNPPVGRLFFEIVAMVGNFCYGYPWVYCTASTFLDGHLLNLSHEVKAVSNYLVKTALAFTYIGIRSIQENRSKYSLRIQPPPYKQCLLCLSGFTRLWAWAIYKCGQVCLTFVTWKWESIRRPSIELVRFDRVQ